MKPLLFAIKCKICDTEYIYCLKSGRDFRCYECKKGTSVEAVEKELEDMSEEEYQEIMDEIESLN